MALFVVLLLLAGCSGGEVHYFVASNTGQVVVGPFPDQQTCQEIRAEVEPHAYVSSCWKGR